MMLIDFHTHAFPERIASAAIDKLTYNAGGLTSQTDGTVDSLKREMDRDGVDIAVVQSIATNPAQQTAVNDFAMELNRDERLFAFGSVHPDAPDALDELERLKAAGIKGVKLHPEYQHFYVDDEKMRPIYHKISVLGLITLFHSGYDYSMSPPYHGMPSRLLRALGWFESPVIAAHWGGLGCYTEVLPLLCDRDLWFDLSFGYGTMPRHFAQAILDKHTPDRLLFGSDMPWHRPSWELQLLDTLDMSTNDREKICFRNARSLLGI